jgi:hypothetical protein
MKVNLKPFPKNNSYRKIDVKIDNFDTWALDHTLAVIILPALIQLKQTKHGVPSEVVNDVGGEDWAPQTSFDFYKESHNESWEIASKRWDDILDKMLVLHHPHTEILKIVSYCHTLKLLAQRFDIKLYFVNGLCPWDQDYFVRLLEFMPNDLTTFTKKDILEIDFRNDADIFSLYTIIHNEYDRAGGIDPINWVNLYSSMANNKIDTNFDKQHPGNKSNQLYFQIVKDFLNQKNIN